MEILNSTAYSGKTLTLMLWSLHKFELWLFSKEIVKKFRKNVTRHYGKEWAPYFLNFLLASFGRKWNKKSHNKFDPWVFKFRLSTWQCRGNVFVLFLIWESMWNHYIAVPTGITISFSLGRQYRPAFSLSFLDVYGKSQEERC